MDTRTSLRIESHDHANSSNMNQNSKSCKVMSKLLLPDDLMIHIFHFVPILCLINSARYVSKHFSSTIATSTFTHVYERPARSKPGLYVENHKSHIDSYFLEFKGDLNGQFERNDLGTPPKMGYLIDTCHGILLLSNAAGQHFVVNPIFKSWLRIPCFPISKHHIRVRSQCTITRVPRNAKFKLFYADVLEVSSACWYVFYVLRIGIDSSWKEIARKEAPLDCYVLWKPLYNGGNDLYWITIEEIIMMDVDKEIIVRQYPLHARTRFHVWNPKYLWIGDFLSCIVTGNSFSTYKIYILDLDSGKWSLYHEMGPFDYLAAYGHNLNPISVSFRLWINNQIIFRVGMHQNYSRKNIHFGYNVKTKQLTKIEDVDMGDFEVWLHTNSLVSLPTTPA
ncbi:uncharacterized protein LOC131618273 [Vicia villosa]|uniref:uncharacterized protein LOC131618273 n=1 Tax=Vicia villosa TaxID=3911 RepID=UPI00273B614B|nr:uncharacterized protein LOC131618273 [Vicia villosa]